MLNLNSAKNNFNFPESGKFFIHEVCDYLEMYVFLNKITYGIEDLLTNISPNERKRLVQYINDEIKKDEMLDDYIIGSDVPDDQDHARTCLQYVFKQLKKRIKQLGNKYPFELIHNDNLKLKKDITYQQKKYFILLICTYHNLFSRRESNIITTEFEKISYYMLLKFLPSHAITKELGKNNQLPSLAIEKILSIRDQSGINVRKKKVRNINPRSSQEEGTDIISWIPMHDSNSNKLVFLFQVTCQKDWFEKQYQPLRYKKLFKFSVNPNIGFFIPRLFNEGKSFCRDIDVDNHTLLFDRARILQFLTKRRKGIKKLSITKLVNVELEKAEN